MKRAAVERQSDEEAREALLAVLLRMVDEFRFGMRDLSPDELSDLVRAWGTLNAGETQSEAVLRIATCSRPSA